MSSGRRSIVLAASGVLLWFIAIMVFWAFQPSTDAVPSGVDQRVFVVARGPANTPYSQKVMCNTLFFSSARSLDLPALPDQPTGVTPLKYQRAACTTVHREARLLFAIDTLAFLGLFAAGGWLLMRHRRSLSGASTLVAA